MLKVKERHFEGENTLIEGQSRRVEG